MKRVTVRNRFGVAWWSRELEKMKRTVRKWRKRYQRARKRRSIDERVYWDEYRERMKVYKNAIREAKETNWREFVRKNGNAEPWEVVYKICMGKKRRMNLCGMKRGDKEMITWNESVRVLLDEFFPGAPENDRMNVATNESGRVTKCFEWNEIGESVHCTKVGKAPGIDGINGEMIKKVWRAIPEYVKCLLDSCANEGYFPKEWKIGSVIVLLKSPDKVRNDPRSYRPICLLSVLGKEFERMMVKRLEARMKGRMNDCQYGFRKGRETEDAWHRVKEWVNGMDVKYVLGVFVDFKRAFNYLSWMCVLRKLNEIECEEWLLWKSYFNERKVCIAGVNECVWKDVQRGCPQGSICGPAVWNLMMDELLWTLNEYECKFVAYADDLLVLVGGNSRMDVERKSAVIMNEVSEWGSRVGVEVSIRSIRDCLKRG
jgi:Reverse transcriptase (RNA-dependent DNA polymerase).